MCWYGLFVLDFFSEYSFWLERIRCQHIIPCPTSTTTPPFRAAPILPGLLPFHHPKAARWYHESGGQERGGICWGWAPVTHQPGHGHGDRGGQAWMAPSFAALPKRGHRLHTLAAKHLLSESWGNNTGFSWIKLANFGKLCFYINFTFGLSCNTMRCTADGRGKSFDN